MSTAALHALIERSVDYAGLFPPAELALEPALKNHADYVRSPDEWMLGTFVLPVAKFEAASAQLSGFDQRHRLRISALGPKSGSASEFASALDQAVEAMRDFGSRHANVVSITQLEMPLPPEANAALLASAQKASGDLKVKSFWEASAKDAPRVIKLLADHRAQAKNSEFGFKLRTGGVTEEAFPSVEHFAAALVAAARNRVPIKFTAGLHHPLIKFHESVNTKMYGFLNVLGAGVLAAEHGWDDSPAIEMLEDEDVSSFSFDAISFAWRDWEITTDRIKARRKLVTSFGSCSFDEPREDLRALALL